MQLHLAKIIITNSQSTIFNGGILVENSFIKKVGKKEDFGDLNRINAKVFDHGESLICPGFINLHTHLLYSKVKRLDGNNGLFPWLEKLVDKIKNWNEKDYIKSVNYGIEQALSCGTTFVVENTPNPLSAEMLSKSSLKALVGLEVFGSEEFFADSLFFKYKEDLENLKFSYPSLDFTFSPHAPYDVSKPLWEKLIRWSNENNKPLLTHLEESPEEKKWWQEKSSKGIKFWEKINKLEAKLKYWKKYNSGIDFLKYNELLTENIIATHLCQAEKEDLISLKNKKVKLVHCPRSNFYLNNGTANLKLWSELGIIWGIGTDSFASNQSLDLLEEIRFAVKQQKMIYDYSVPAKEMFKAITLNPAKILSKEDEIGMLKEGTFADFLVFDVKKKSGCTYKDPYEFLVFDIDNKNDLKEVWINGKKAWI